MTAALSKMLKLATEITSDNLVDLIKGAMALHSRNLREEYCAFKFGMTYEQFQTWGKSNQVLAEPYLDELTRLKFGASVLVAGFVADEEGEPYPAICKVSNQTGEVTLEEHFGAIGEGATVAIPPLLRREYDWEETSLPKAIYYLYEAKTLAEIIDSVGTSTSIDVLYPNGTLKSLEAEGYDYYAELLKEFGPKPRVTNVDWKDGYLGPFDNEDKKKKPSDLKQPASLPSASPKSKLKR
jgi:hypothetical protein